MRSTRRRLAVSVVALVGLVPVGFTVAAPPAFAANITVTTDADSGPGSLRAAVAAAAPGDTITFASNLLGVPIKLTTGQIVIDKNLTIRGNGFAFTTIRREAGSPNFRIFHVTAATVTIDSVSITGGRIGPVPPPAEGGGILVAAGANLTLSRSHVSFNHAEGAGASANGGGLHIEGGTVSIDHSVVFGNTATGNNAEGAGIHQEAGTMILTDSLVSNNTATANGGVFGVRGGGIRTVGDVALTNTDVTNNRAVNTQATGSAFGAGIHHTAGLLTMTEGAIRSNTTQAPGDFLQGGGLTLVAGATGILSRVEISENRLVGGGIGRGGGIRNFNSHLNVINSTIALNESPNRGGAIFLSEDATASFSSSTLASNTAVEGSIISNFSTTAVSVNNTILANSGPGAMCEGSVTDAGANLTFGGIVGTCPDVGGSPELGPLQFNGGPTRTMALGARSAAINQGSGCPATDQRRFLRNVGPCDLGAFEFGASANDANQPVCAVSAIRSDNPKQMDVTVSDNSTGLDVVTPTKQQNGVVNVPYFQRGSRNPVIVTATKINQALATSWAFTATDMAGNTKLCT